MATIVLDNERRRNAMTKDMWQQFQPVLQHLADKESVKVVVVRGAGEHFSAGADISDLKDILHDPDTGRHDGGHVSAGENALASFPKPTIAAVDGYCIGGGWQIAGACDIRLATDRSTFGITPAKVGIVYPLSGIERLVRLAGPATAKYLLFSGDFIPAAEAMSLGLLARVIPHSNFWTETTALAERLASRSQLSIQAMKDIVDIISQGRDGLGEANAAWQREMVLSGEPEIGIEAFLGKKTPEFKWTRRDSRLFEL
ncbi:enoyl-CoA hydratase/isomerase family protein [Arthrobacter sp. NPDC057013]|uniref:enoyl-CoA hydratase/isomerase family protein n=1 Tax=Arthrobacter sp. NPDC057013 TaxID=3345999 RepID=UPI003636DB2C